MARSFGEDKGEDNENDKDRSGYQEGAAWNGGSRGDEADSTELVPTSEYHAEDLREDAAEGQHLLLDFVRTEMLRNGLETELPCLANQQPAEDSVDPER